MKLSKSRVESEDMVLPVCPAVAGDINVTDVHVLPPVIALQLSALRVKLM